MKCVVVIDKKTKKVVHTVECRNNSDPMKVMKGMFIHLDHAKYRLEIRDADQNNVNS